MAVVDVVRAIAGRAVVARVEIEREITMSTYQFTVVIEADEDGFHAYVPVLPGCHTFGSTVEEARANIIEAMELHVEALQAGGEPVPLEREPLFITRLAIPVAV